MIRGPSGTVVEGAFGLDPGEVADAGTWCRLAEVEGGDGKFLGVCDVSGEKSLWHTVS